MNNELKYDTRLVDKLLSRKQLTRQELDAHLATLPDVAAKADNVEAALADLHQAPAVASAPAKGKKG